MTPVTLRRYSTRSLDALADTDINVARRLRSLSASQLRAGRDRVVLLGRKNAAERIARFLLEMVGRMFADGQALIELPMNRTDMAEYLGLTIETVCRSLTQLHRNGTIAVGARKDRNPRPPCTRCGQLCVPALGPTSIDLRQCTPYPAGFIVGNSQYWLVEEGPADAHKSKPPDRHCRR